MAQRLVRAKRKIARRRHPLRGPARRRPARAAAVSVLATRLPGLQRGLRGDRRRRARAARAVRRGDPARARARRADARRAARRSALLALMLLHDSRRDARVDADGRARAARRPGPLALGPRGDRRGRCALVARAWRWAAGPVPAAGADRRRARARARRTRLGRGSPWLYDRCSARVADAGRRAQPRRRGRDGATGRRPGSRWSTRSPSARRLPPLHAARADLLRRLGAATRPRRLPRGARARRQPGRARLPRTPPQRGLITPCSVTSAHTSSAGVTSNAGLRQGVPAT